MELDDDFDDLLAFDLEEVERRAQQHKQQEHQRPLHAEPPPPPQPSSCTGQPAQPPHLAVRQQFACCSAALGQENRPTLLQDSTAAGTAAPSCGASTFNSNGSSIHIPSAADLLKAGSAPTQNSLPGSINPAALAQAGQQQQQWHQQPGQHSQASWPNQPQHGPAHAGAAAGASGQHSGGAGSGSGGAAGGGSGSGGGGGVSGQAPGVWQPQQQQQWQQQQQQQQPPAVLQPHPQQQQQHTQSQWQHPLQPPHQAQHFQQPHPQQGQQQPLQQQQPQQQQHIPSWNQQQFSQLRQRPQYQHPYQIQQQQMCRQQQQQQQQQQQAARQAQQPTWQQQQQQQQQWQQWQQKQQQLVQLAPEDLIPRCPYKRCPGVFSQCGAKLRWVQKHGKGFWSCSLFPKCDYKYYPAQQVSQPELGCEVVDSQTFRLAPQTAAEVAVRRLGGVRAVLAGAGLKLAHLELPQAQQQQPAAAAGGEPNTAGDDGAAPAAGVVGEASVGSEPAVPPPAPPAAAEAAAAAAAAEAAAPRDTGRARDGSAAELAAAPSWEWSAAESMLLPLSQYEHVEQELRRCRPPLLGRGGAIPPATLAAFREPDAGLCPQPEVSARFEAMPASLRDALMPFQREGVLYGLTHGGRVLIADEMGVGKTVQALALASCYQEEWPLLIIVPASLRLVWAEEIERWLPHVRPGGVTVIEGKEDRLTDLPDVGRRAELPAITITSYEMMKRLSCPACQKLQGAANAAAAKAAAAAAAGGGASGGAAAAGSSDAAAAASGCGGGGSKASPGKGGGRGDSSGGGRGRGRGRGRKGASSGSTVAAASTEADASHATTTATEARPPPGHKGGVAGKRCAGCTGPDHCMAALPWGVVIIDESHNLRTTNTRQADSPHTEAAVAASSAALRVVLLSGTPSLSRPYDLFRQVDVLYPGILGRTKDDFAHRYCDRRLVPVRGSRNSRPGPDGGQRMRWNNAGGARLVELHGLLVRRVMVRRLKKDVLTQLPPKRRQVIRLPHPPAHRWPKQEVGPGPQQQQQQQQQQQDGDDTADADPTTTVNPEPTGTAATLDPEMTAAGSMTAAHRVALAKLPDAIEWLMAALGSSEPGADADQGSGGAGGSSSGKQGLAAEGVGGGSGGHRRGQSGSMKPGWGQGGSSSGGGGGGGGGLVGAPADGSGGGGRSRGSEGAAAAAAAASSGGGDEGDAEGADGDDEQHSGHSAGGHAGGTGPKFLVFAHHKDIMDKLAAALAGYGSQLPDSDTNSHNSHHATAADLDADLAQEVLGAQQAAARSGTHGGGGYGRNSSTAAAKASGGGGGGGGSSGSSVRSGWRGVGYVRVDGSHDSTERLAAVKKFKHDPSIRVALLSITAAAVGLDFSSASMVVFVELPHEVSLVRQAEDRAHRKGQAAKSVNVYFLCAQGTVDDKQWQALNLSLAHITQVHDGEVLPQPLARAAVAAAGAGAGSGDGGADGGGDGGGDEAAAADAEDGVTAVGTAGAGGDADAGTAAEPLPEGAEADTVGQCVAGITECAAAAAEAAAPASQGGVPADTPCRSTPAAPPSSMDPPAPAAAAHDDGGVTQGVDGAPNAAAEDAGPCAQAAAASPAAAAAIAPSPGTVTDADPAAATPAQAPADGAVQERQLVVVDLTADSPVKQLHGANTSSSQQQPGPIQHHAHASPAAAAVTPGPPATTTAVAGSSEAAAAPSTQLPPASTTAAALADPPPSQLVAVTAPHCSPALRPPHSSSQKQHRLSSPSAAARAFCLHPVAPEVWFEVSKHTNRLHFHLAADGSRPLGLNIPLESLLLPEEGTQQQLAAAWDAAWARQIVQLQKQQQEKEKKEAEQRRKLQQQQQQQQQQGKEEDHTTQQQQQQPQRQLSGSQRTVSSPFFARPVADRPNQPSEVAARQTLPYYSDAAAHAQQLLQQQQASHTPAQRTTPACCGDARPVSGGGGSNNITTTAPFQTPAAAGTNAAVPGSIRSSSRGRAVSALASLQGLLPFGNSPAAAAVAGASGAQTAGALLQGSGAADGHCQPNAAATAAAVAASAGVVASQQQQEEDGNEVVSATPSPGAGGHVGGGACFDGTGAVRGGGSPSGAPGGAASGGVGGAAAGCCLAGASGGGVGAAAAAGSSPPDDGLLQRMRQLLSPGKRQREPVLRPDNCKQQQQGGDVNGPGSKGHEQQMQDVQQQQQQHDGATGFPRALVMRIDSSGSGSDEDDGDDGSGSRGKGGDKDTPAAAAAAQGVSSEVIVIPASEEEDSEGVQGPEGHASQQQQQQLVHIDLLSQSPHCKQPSQQPNRPSQQQQQRCANAATTAAANCDQQHQDKEVSALGLPGGLLVSHGGGSQQQEQEEGGGGVDGAATNNNSNSNKPLLLPDCRCAPGFMSPSGLACLTLPLSPMALLDILRQGAAFAADWSELRSVTRNRLVGRVLPPDLASAVEAATAAAAGAGAFGVGTTRYLQDIQEGDPNLPAGARLVNVSVHYPNGRQQLVTYRQAFTGGVAGGSSSSSISPLVRHCINCFKPVEGATAAEDAVLQGALDLFCSLECERSWSIKSSSGGIRRALFKLERGVCQLCTLDCHALVAQLQQVSKDSPHWLQHRRAVVAALAPKLLERGCGNLLDRLLNQATEGNAWHADHILAVYEGGGGCELDNLRTLCVACHAAVTKKQAAARAAERQRRKLGTADIRTWFGGVPDGGAGGGGGVSKPQAGLKRMRRARAEGAAGTQFVDDEDEGVAPSIPKAGSGGSRQVQGNKTSAVTAAAGGGGGGAKAVAAAGGGGGQKKRGRPAKKQKGSSGKPPAGAAAGSSRRDSQIHKWVAAAAAAAAATGGDATPAAAAAAGSPSAAATPAAAAAAGGCPNTGDVIELLDDSQPDGGGSSSPRAPDSAAAALLCGTSPSAQQRAVKKRPAAAAAEAAGAGAGAAGLRTVLDQFRFSQEEAASGGCSSQQTGGVQQQQQQGRSQQQEREQQPGPSLDLQQQRSTQQQTQQRQQQQQQQQAAGRQGVKRKAASKAAVAAAAASGAAAAVASKKRTRRGRQQQQAAVAIDSSDEEGGGGGGGESDGGGGGGADSDFAEGLTAAEKRQLKLLSKQ